MCLECGFYKGRQVIDLVEKKKSREARMQAKREARGISEESVAPSDAEAVSKQAPEESKIEEEKKDSK